MLTQTEKSIIRTLAFFDIFNFPLTKEELWQNLWSTDALIKPNSDELFAEFNRALERLIPKHVTCVEGFYSIDKTTAPQKVEKRKKNYLVAINKIKIALKNARLICRLPHIRAIFLCNNLAYNNAREDSDIDFFVITTRQRLFTAKFFSSALLKILNRRPTKHDAKNKICLSFMIAENRLRLGDLLYPDDVYFHYWFKQLVPIFDPDNFAAKLWEDNSWVKIKLPNANFFSSSRRMFAKKRNSALKRIAEFFCGDISERICRQIQLSIMPADTKKKAAEGSPNVVVRNDIIKLHTNDRRLFFKKQWQEKYSKIYEQA
jgi:hypothetical protein